MDIRVDNLKNSKVIALLNEHLQNMEMLSPPESVHALDIDGLRQPGITFWTAWEKGKLAGCAALKELSSMHGEIKSMKTATGFLRRGVAACLLEYLIEEAKRRDYQRLSLETGSIRYFEAARKLYSRFGFRCCPPFGSYIEDPHSVFMTKQIKQ